MTTKLQLFNRAISHLSTSRLATVTENVAARHELDAVYSEVLQECLEEGNWKFAKRSLKIEYDTAIETDFGFTYGFTKPSDYVRLINICSDEFFRDEVDEFSDENGFWFCDLQTIYIAMVSNDEDYGLNLGGYPENYSNFVGYRLAERTSLPITRDKYTRNMLTQESKDALAKAKRLDAINEPVKRKPPGRLVVSRVGQGTRPRFANGRMRFS